MGARLRGTRPRSRRAAPTAVIALVAVAALTAASCGGHGEPTATPTTSTTATTSFSIDIGAGAAALKQGDINGATQLFMRAVALQPGSALAHYDLGTVYQQAREERNALIQYADALRIAPDDTAAQFNRAVIYTDSDAPLAEFLYRRVISLQPSAATAYLNLGLLEMTAKATGARAQGRKDVAEAVHLEPSLAEGLPASVRAGLSKAASAPVTTSTSRVPITN